MRHLISGARIEPQRAERNNSARFLMQSPEQQLAQAHALEITPLTRKPALSILV